MGLKTKQLHETKTLATSTTATLQVPIGGKIQNMILRFATSAGADVTEAAIRAEIGNIRFTINGRDVVNCSAAQLLNAYEVLGQNVNDRAGLNSVVELNVGRLLFTDPNLRDAFGYGTADVQSLQISVTAGTLSTIANVQAFTARDGVNENLGVYMKLINYVVSFNSTGDHTVDTLPRDPDTSYMFVMLDAGASGTQTFGEVKVNNISIEDRIPHQVRELWMSSDRLATPTGLTVYSFNDGSLTSRLPMVGVNDLRFIQTFSVAPGAGGYNMTVLSAVNLPTRI